jgi:hypothetical protein
MSRGRPAFRGVGSKPEACERKSFEVRRDDRPTSVPLKIYNLEGNVLQHFRENPNLSHARSAFNSCLN